MPNSLRLASGLQITNPVASLRTKFEEWPWEKYDGAPVADPNVVTNADVDRVYQLGARSSRKSYTELIDNRGREITRCLLGISVETSLEGSDAEVNAIRAPMIEVTNIVTEQKAIKLAGATKLLAPFRPRLIPVIDSVIENYYWFALSISSEPEFRQLQQAFHQSWGEYVWSLIVLMRKDVLRAREELSAIRDQFSETPMASISLVRILESLIWFYYARGHNYGETA